MGAFNIKRVQGWESILSAHIEEAKYKPFVRGVHDCALFACDGIFKMTGYDPAAHFRGHYTTLIGAKRALTKYGAGDLESTAAEKFGEPCSLLMARRGDPVLVPCPEGVALALVDMTGRRAVTTAQEGLVSYRMENWVKAWRVG